ncbi:MAG: hypothetical protein GKS01_11320 [Alphaproteobacteria bacterium]|nr:hypothetical protein [Alphaproteobacteria bacterium]
MADQQKPDEKKYWLDDQNNVKKIIWALYIVCGLSVIADFFYHKHVHYAAEDWIPGMYGWYGFIGCVFLVLSAKVLRKILMRDEDYYDEADDD